jgi:uncharacterized protein (TIGR00252 family)
MTTFDTGRKAEAVVAAYLERQGCTIRDMNWRTRWCEIDIVAMRQDVVYFCEVKYRQSSAYGHGLEYVTPRKVRQMRFAADFWIATHAWYGTYQLCAISVCGEDFRIDAVIKDI